MHKALILAGCCAALAVPTARAQSTSRIKLMHGPATATLGSIGQIDVPEQFIFIDGKTVQQLMKAHGEPVSGNELGELSPTNADWSIMFRWSDIGYVKDEDKSKLIDEADKLLQQIRDNTEAANKLRAEAGTPPIHVIGWEVPPRYNEETHNLEWAVKGECEGRQILNYDTRVLGRKGVLNVKLIVAPDDFADTLPAFTNVMAGYAFRSGQSYAEYRPGDKVAKYGLAALIVGGAAVGAAKLGLLGPLLILLKKAWKLVVVAFAAVVGFFKKMFARITGRDRETIPKA